MGIYKYIHMSVKLTKNRIFSFRGKIEKLYSTKVTPFGNGAKIGCEKDYMNRDAIVLILKKGETL